MNSLLVAVTEKGRPSPSPRPAPPTGLTATPNGTSEIDLSWNTVSDATGYQIMRGTTSGGPYSTLSTTTGTSFNGTGLVPGRLTER